MAHLLIAGIPGTGKTKFSTWLAETHGYLHIDVDTAVENDQAIQVLLHRDVFNVRAVAEDLKSRGPDVVLDWGFVPSLLGRVRQLIRSGFEPWWFTGDEKVAREAFLDNGVAPEALFDLQMADIRASWERIEKVFEGHILNVIDSGPSGLSRLSPAEVFNHMSVGTPGGTSGSSSS